MTRFGFHEAHVTTVMLGDLQKSVPLECGITK